MVFCDLRRFTAFAETSEPEEVMTVLGEYHAALGDLIHRFEGTLEQFAGDGLMVFFNDPLPCDDPALRAVRMAVAMRGRIQDLADGWRGAATTSASRVGIAQGFATLGRIGFEGRYDYAAIGSVTNLAVTAVLGGDARTRSWSPSGCSRSRRGRRQSAGSGEIDAARLHPAGQVYDVKGLDAAR